MAPTLPLLPIALLTLTFNHAFATPIPQNGDGGGSGSLPDGGLGYDPASAGDTVPGADGTDTGGVQLSKGAIIAIAVVAGLVVITGITTAILFWGAKKRQWAVAETMRRSVRRVTTGIKAMTPRTPHKMTFSPVEKRRRADSFGDGLLHGSNNKRSAVAAAAPTARNARDLEKGGAAPTSTHNVKVWSEGAENVPVGGQRPAPGGKSRPVPPRVQVPASKFEMDSPKTPMWNKVFGR